jgi:hypothetical protein
MKNRKKELQEHNVRFNQNRPMPQIREDPDSREHEEQIIKGDDVSYNVKDHHNKPKRKKDFEIKQNL